MDLPQTTNLTTAHHDEGLTPWNKVRVLNPIVTCALPYIPHEAQDQRLRLRERRFVMECGRPDAPNVPRLEYDLRDFKQALREFAVLVQPEDVHQRRQQRGPERRAILVQRIPNPDPVRRLDLVRR